MSRSNRPDRTPEYRAFMVATFVMATLGILSGASLTLRAWISTGFGWVTAGLGAIIVALLIREGIAELRLAIEFRQAAIPRAGSPRPADVQDEPEHEPAAPPAGGERE